jgi:phage-related holin
MLHKKAVNKQNKLFIYFNQFGGYKMKLEKLLILITTSLSFIGTFFFKLTAEFSEQYTALLAVVLIDGIFGIIAGTKREGFQTRKALKVLRTAVTWIVILTVLLLVEKGFPGTGWLSETILFPFIIFQLMSALKNASMAGYIQTELLNKILDRFDNHKGDRK